MSGIDLGRILGDGGFDNDPEDAPVDYNAHVADGHPRRPRCRACRAVWPCDAA